MSGDGERGRGILSSADRAYLRGEREYGSVQAERNARARIRGRVVEALLDVPLLVEALEERDREQVFDALDGAGTDGFDALVATMALCYEAADGTGLEFRTLVREGVNLVAAREDRSATVDLELTYHAMDADQLLAKLEDGTELSLTEIAHLYDAEGVSREELAARFEDREDLDDGRVQSKVTDYGQ